MTDTQQTRLLKKGAVLEFVKTGAWEFVRRRDRQQGVVLIALTNDEKLILVEQFRPPIGTQVIELPAGSIKPGATPEGTAAAELREEARYTFQRLTRVAQGPTSPGMTADHNILYLATGLHRGDRNGKHLRDGSFRYHETEGAAGEQEKIIVWEVPLAALRNWLKRREAEGKVIDLRVYAGLFFVQQRRSRKRT